MKKFLISSVISLGIVSSISAIEKRDLPKAKMVNYFRMGNHFPIKDIGMYSAHAVNIGVGSRFLHTYGFDVSSHFTFNQNFIQTNLEGNFLIQPPKLCGFYIGIGAKGGQILTKTISMDSIYIGDNITDEVFDEDGKLISCNREEVYYPIVKENWDLNWFKDFPFTIGFGKEFDGKYQFVQAQINKDLHIMVASGFGF